MDEGSWTPSQLNNGVQGYLQDLNNPSNVTRVFSLRTMIVLLSIQLPLDQWMLEEVALHSTGEARVNIYILYIYIYIHLYIYRES